MAEDKHLLTDNPIKTEEQDIFNFKHYAKKVQNIIQFNSSNIEPFTIGVYGKWGEGKTSFLNLLEEKIEHFNKTQGDKEYCKFHFNPWRYSSEDEMLFDFFDSLSKMFYVEKESSKQKVGKWIRKYSKYLKAVKLSANVGIPMISKAKMDFEPHKIFEALGEDLVGKEVTIEALKDKVNDAVTKADFKVVVFIDDVDRLDKDEIYTILKLIKLNANFSNFIFIVALDSDYVAKAIKDRYGNEVEDGKLFLEKIINVPIHLPKIEDEDLQYFFELNLMRVFSSLMFNNQQEKISEVEDIIKLYNPLYFKSPREVKRVLNGFFVGAFAIGDEVNLKDLFWIEWLKLKNEELYSLLKNYRHNHLFEEDRVVNFNDDYKSSVKAVIEEDASTRKINGTRKDIIKRFPEYEWFLNEFFPFEGFYFFYEEFELKQKINSSLHYDKYFSYHTHRKVKSFELQEIEKNINQKNDEGLKNNLENLFSKDKSIYILESLLKKLRKVNERNYLFEIVCKNIALISSDKGMFSFNYRARIISLIARMIRNDDKNDNEIIVDKLSKLISLDFDDLIHFMVELKKDNPLLVYPEKEYIKKYKKILKNKPFYIVSDEEETRGARWFIHLWKKHEPEKLKKYLEDSIKSEERIKKLIRLFSDKASSQELTLSQYNYLKANIDVHLLYNKLVEFNSKLVFSVGEYMPIDNSYESTEEDNLREFVKWYNKDDKK